ncbi:GSCFA domain-containing protein [Kordiimonas sp.]|uniref:GSCFA domain-containing protein n=1 Tax=Kordiimonas sp. TaxID=1970157 RepID=UPI003A8D6365
MNPYGDLDDNHFWNRQVGGKQPEAIEYDPAPKFRFDIEKDIFATAGSCFAQHFARELVRRGGQYLVAERAHPLVARFDHGYGVFSARYGNIYTTRQLYDLLSQATEQRETIYDIGRRKDGKFVDLLRPGAVPRGFCSVVEAKADRIYHLSKVISAIQAASVFVFTLGLTEVWENTVRDYVYPLCPGTLAGNFDSQKHQFANHSFQQVETYLQKSLEILWSINPRLKVLLTVSPVMLVATYEARGAVQSSIASKSILRAVADASVRANQSVDYFPSYEIIVGSQASGKFFRDGARDVADAGVNCVMDYFFRSRMAVEGTTKSQASTEEEAKADLVQQNTDQEIKELFQVECDELILDRKL